jgi:hypothetical protein
MLRNAVAVAVPDAIRISVDLQEVRFTLPDGYRRRYPTPRIAAYNLASFEAGDPVEPFTFTLRQGAVYDSTQGESRPGTPAAIRAWALGQGVITPAEAARKKALQGAVKEAYTAATGVSVLPQKEGRSKAMTRAARSNIRGDRFYGLRLANGFRPGGEVTGDGHPAP